MIRKQIIDQTPLTCEKCKKIFGTIQNLEQHTRKRIPCDRVLKCGKCNKEFKHTGNLRRHHRRKTPCDLIAGDPTIEVDNMSCIFCRRAFKSKYNVKAHYNVCKIKNGGMSILFDEVKRLKEKNNEIQNEMKILKNKLGATINGDNNINGNDNNVLNHTNTEINFTINCFGGDEAYETMQKILQSEAPKLLYKDQACDLPRTKQIQDRITELVLSCYRNPDHKELQNVYVTDPQTTKDNAFVHKEGKWIINDWSKINKVILGEMFNMLDRCVKKKQDVMNVMKHIFTVAGLGEANVEKMTIDEMKELYYEIGRELNFKTIIL